MNIRTHGVLVGLAAGAVAAGTAAIIEALIVTARLVTLGRFGGRVGSSFFMIVVVGALIGALLGYFMGLARSRSSSEIV